MIVMVVKIIVVKILMMTMMGSVIHMISAQRVICCGYQIGIQILIMMVVKMLVKIPMMIMMESVILRIYV